MRHIISALLILSVIAFSSTGYAQQEKKANLWEEEFVMALQKGKASLNKKGEGLAYTPAPGVVLEKAIKKAMKMQAPACEAMKIAVDLKYDAYSVIKNIFGSGSQVNLNQVCMCATESGINKQIVAEAAANATSPLGTPIFERDEITQAQCLTGLGYTPYASVIPRVTPKKKPKPVSPKTPSEPEDDDDDYPNDYPDDGYNGQTGPV